MVSYDVKANLTTILSTYLIPVLVGYGFSEATSSAVVGLVVSIVIIGAGMLNERYTSKHLTKSDDDYDADESELELTDEEESEFTEDTDDELPEFESESVSLSRLG